MMESLSLDERRIIVDFGNERQGVRVEAMNRIAMASTVDWIVMDRTVVDRTVVDGTAVQRTVVDRIQCAYRMMNWAIGVTQMVQVIKLVQMVQQIVMANRI